jgi:glycine/D-amino acid oxidase-like deaminating enzyme
MTSSINLSPMKKRTITHLPIEDDCNGWSQILPERIVTKPVVGLHRPDWIVLGAGYAGLAAARRLADNRPNDHIALVDANEVGENASGRNSGFAIDLPHNVGSSMEELEGSHRFMALAREAIKYHETQIDRYQIDCDWRVTGKYHAAVSDRGVDQVLEPFAKELEVLGEPCQWIEKAELSKRLGTEHFTAAVYTPGCRLFNPAALTRGLADNLPENVTLF